MGLFVSALRGMRSLSAARREPEEWEGIGERWEERAVGEGSRGPETGAERCFVSPCAGASFCSGAATCPTPHVVAGPAGSGPLLPKDAFILKNPPQQVSFFVGCEEEGDTHLTTPTTCVRRGEQDTLF